MQIQHTLTSRKSNTLTNIEQHKKLINYYLKVTNQAVIGYQTNFSYKHNTLFWHILTNKQTTKISKKFSILRSAHVFKKAQEHFIMTTYKKNTNHNISLKILINKRAANENKKLHITTILMNCSSLSNKTKFNCFEFVTL